MQRSSGVMMVRDVMVRDVICVRSDMDLRDLAKLFLQQGITGAPVVDAQGDLVGVISQRDLLFYSLSRSDELVLDSDFYHRVRVEGQHIPKGYQIEDTNTGCVSDVMTPVVHAVSESASVDSVARMMTRKHIHRVIVRRGRKVAGIVSALDVLRTLTRNGAPRPRPAPKRAVKRARKGAARG
jgi:CBS domain-containing protein